MSYCSKCGSYIPDSALKCPACGKLKIGAAETAQQAERQAKPQSGFDGSSAQQTQSYHYGYTQSGQQTGGQSRPQQDQYDRYRTDFDFGTAPKDDDVEDNKVLGAVSYLGPLVILSMILKPNSPFVRFHANQSIGLILFSILCSVCSIVPVFGGLISTFGGIFTAVNVFRGFFGALGGKTVKLPIVGDIHILDKRGETK